MNNLIYISDFLYPEVIGGGELNDHELCSIVEQKGRVVIKKKSPEVTLSFLKENKNNFFIISNFILLKPACVDYIQQNLRYIIYEHDHKYLKSRNPAFYDDYLAPKDQIINYLFYKNARSIFCQSKFHKEIIFKNLDLDNLTNLAGNLWSLDSLSFLEECSKKQKQDSVSIMLSDNWHKNTKEAIRYCDAKNIKYSLIKSGEYKDFLSLLSQNKKLVFFPKTPETLSRICVESRMMNMSVITNKNVGATYEEWFVLKGKELIKVMTHKREQIVATLIGIMNG